MLEIILKFRCIWCNSVKRVTVQRAAGEEIDIDDFRVCARCKLERKHDAVSGT